MSECLFCRIIAGDIPCDKIYEDDDVLAFQDINPVAPLHALIIPKRHIASLNDLEADDDRLIGKLFLAAKKIAEQEGYAADGYRTVINCGESANQTVFHIHLHLIAGRSMRWPPG